MRMTMLFLTLAACAAGGCGSLEEAAKRAKDHAEGKKADAEKDAEAPTRSAVFASPVPNVPDERPANFRAMAAADRVQFLRHLIDEDNQKITDTVGVPRPGSRQILEAAEALQGMVQSVRRSNADLTMASTDLLREWDVTQAAYEDKAADLRRRAKAFKNKDLARLLDDQAGAMDRQAKDCPRRKALTAGYLALLAENSDYLAEAEPALGEIVVAMRILTAGKVPLADPEQIRLVDQQLKGFLKLINTFAAEVRARDPVAAEQKAEADRKAAEQKPKDPPTGDRPDPAAAALSPPLHKLATAHENDGFTCSDCGKVHPTTADVVLTRWGTFAKRIADGRRLAGPPDRAGDEPAPAFDDGHGPDAPHHWPTHPGPVYVLGNGSDWICAKCGRWHPGIAPHGSVPPGSVHISQVPGADRRPTPPPETTAEYLARTEGRK